MKNRNFLIAAIFLQTAIFLGAQTPDTTTNPILFTSRGITDKFGLWNAQSNTLTFTNNATIPLDTQVQNSTQWIKAKYPNNPDSYIIGHSMGGLRALGMASAAGSSVKGVLTVGSPVSGLTPLTAPGVDGMKSRLWSVIRAVGRGMMSSSSVHVISQDPKYFWILMGYDIASVSFSVLVGAIDAILSVVNSFRTVTVQDEIAFKVALNFIGQDAAAYPLIEQILMNSGAPVINDMKINSEFMKKYLKKLELPYGEAVSFEKDGYYFKVCTGYNSSYQPTYVTYFVKYQDTQYLRKRIPSDTYVMHVQGTNKQIWKTILDDMPENTRKDVVAFKESMISYMDKSSTYLQAVGDSTWANKYNDPGSFAYWLFAMGHISQSQSDINQAKSYLVDPDNILKTVYGHDQHDGLIPTNDQYDLFIGGKSIFPLINPSSIESRVWAVPFDHLQEMRESLIWGLEGGLGNEDLSNPGKIARYTTAASDVESLSWRFLAASSKDGMMNAISNGANDVRSKRSF